MDKKVTGKVKSEGFVNSGVKWYWPPRFDGGNRFDPLDEFGHDPEPTPWGWWPTGGGDR